MVQISLDLTEGGFNSEQKELKTEKWTSLGLHQFLTAHKQFKLKRIEDKLVKL